MTEVNREAVVAILDKLIAERNQLRARVAELIAAGSALEERLGELISDWHYQTHGAARSLGRCRVQTCTDALAALDGWRSPAMATPKPCYKTRFRD